MSKLKEFYDKNIHITKDIDDIMSKISKKWKNLSKKERYNLIHLTMVSMLLL